MVAYGSSQMEQSSTLLSVTATGLEGMAWNCVGGGVRERFFTRGQWARNRLPRAVGTAPGARGQGVFGQCSHTHGLNFGWSCVELGVDDPFGSRPTHVILQPFYDIL